jgi:3'(2'), 5'-bisphosphate nucleotidase
MLMDESAPEVVVAIEAMKAASALCQRIQDELVGGDSILKSDRSPVTIADFGSQAIVSKWIKERFPDDPIVAEEDSKELRKAQRSALLEKVTHYVGRFIPRTSSQDILDWIDLSSHELRNRYWTLDPIDGTKGFLRGAQYAIALALVEEGQVKMGLMACPSLHWDKESLEEEKGCLFLGLRGKGAFQMGLKNERRRNLSVSKVRDPQEATLTESVELDHADHLCHERLSQHLGISKSPIKMDSQAKYGIVARGEVDLYLRVPSPSEPGYKEKIWDHAAGSIIAEEAGGRVTDTLGRGLDFSSSVRMERNHGILVTNGFLHQRVLDALLVCSH